MKRPLVFLASLLVTPLAPFHAAVSLIAFALIFAVSAGRGYAATPGEDIPGGSQRLVGNGPGDPGANAPLENHEADPMNTRGGKAKVKQNTHASNADVRIPPGTTYVYKTSHGQPQKMEVYVPKDRHPAGMKLPAVLLFHGGGWSGGDLNQFRYACDYFARRGLVAATANYYMNGGNEAKALGPGGKRKRVCVTDGVSAIRWLKGHADELGIDAQRLLVGGGSAGGHIAMMATLNRDLDDPSDPKDIDTSVIGYLLFNPAFIAPGGDRDDEVDVFKHLRAGIAPALVMFGAQDPWKPAAENLVCELRKTGARAELLVADNIGHGFWMQPKWNSLCMVECDRFLVSLGVLKGEPLVQKADGIDFNPAQSSR